MIIDRPKNININNEYEKLYKLYKIKDRSDYNGSIQKIECVINNERGLFKERLSTQSKDHIMEQVAYDIALILGVSCCKNSCRKIKNGLYGSFSRFEVVDMNNVAEYSSIIGIIDGSVDDILNRTTQLTHGVNNFVIQLYQYLIFDYILGQLDRHMDNLSVYKSKNSIQWYPLYDNGYCCFSTYGNDSAIQSLKNGFYLSRLGYDNEIFESLYRHRNTIYSDDIRKIIRYNKINRDILIKIFNKANKYNQLTDERRDASIEFILGNIKDIDALNNRRSII